ncbi:unnamed protein product [Lactuca virosa]|uniref:Uncharacterized protein n=1 Tax=Lactuca virosa TaxID=75947 RepID=A0AAU9NYY7_9ASTR|nr:unnamed protein product [Lactuca virosa]
MSIIIIIEPTTEHHPPPSLPLQNLRIRANCFKCGGRSYDGPWLEITYSWVMEWQWFSMGIPTKPQYLLSHLPNRRLSLLVQESQEHRVILS